MDYEKLTKTEATDLIVAEFKERKIKEKKEKSKKEFEEDWGLQLQALRKKHDEEIIQFNKDKQAAYNETF